MAWTIACYCGNVYTAPPDRCEICGTTLEPSASTGADEDSRRPADVGDVDIDAVLTPARGQGNAVGWIDEQHSRATSAQRAVAVPERTA